MPLVKSVENEDVVNLSSNASSGDNASMLESVVKKKKVEKFSREEL